MRKFWHNHGLSVTLLGIFVFCMTGQIIAGWKTYNDDQRQHGESRVDLGDYFATGHFWEATAENWESEFLQMAMYLVLTAVLFQRGSAESKDPDGQEAVDADPAGHQNDAGAPWPVRRGGWVMRLYCHSLSITFALLFLISFWMHVAGGVRQQNEERRSHGEALISTGQYLASSQFWFESFQNWQSEFLSLLAMVYLSVYLRQKGSPESKPVPTPHHMSESAWEERQDKQQTPGKRREEPRQPGEGEVEGQEGEKEGADQWRQEKGVKV